MNSVRRQLEGTVFGILSQCYGLLGCDTLYFNFGSNVQPTPVTV
jgi:hypothetical protein